jgi:phosphoribosylaminoimidazole-succinocarboxamide synthase
MQTTDYKEFIKQNLDYTLEETNFDFGTKKQGKVRDGYFVDDKVYFVSTDRQSAFDRILAGIPFKGQVLNQTSSWWFQKTKEITPNHFLESPDPNVSLCNKHQIFPVEVVIRDYLTGTTGTSIWQNYQKGVRNYCGSQLPEGLTKNQKLPQTIITPTTKSDIHDELISREEIVTKGLATQKEWDYISRKALEIFDFAQREVDKRGLILVDTKLEFAKDEQGNIFLADEIFTPDSSRFWLKESYQERISKGQEPENIDKEFLRLWFVENCDPYNDKDLPPAPNELITELSLRYIRLYEMITGNIFDFPDTGSSLTQRIQDNLQFK